MDRKKLSANNNWRFYRGNPPLGRNDGPGGNGASEPWSPNYDDTGWEVVSLPHTVREEALMCSGGLNYQGISWYRLHFIIPQEFEHREMYFELEAAMQRVDAWLDGEPLGIRNGGFLPMAFSLTGISVEEEHVLSLKVDNSDMLDIPPGKPQGSLDFCYFGGLYRDAWLHIMNKVHFTSAVHARRIASGGLFIRYLDVSQENARIAVDAHFINQSNETVQVQVCLLLNNETVYTGEPRNLKAGKEVVEEAIFNVSAPLLWHPDHPFLYQLKAQLYQKDVLLDEISERIGIRTTEFRKDGFYLNGEKLFLNGANRHQEYAYVGFAIPDALQRRDAVLLRKAGINSIRLGHYPQDSAFMDACDELGILCVIPTPGWQEHPSSVAFDENSYENTRRMIRMYRNHPSVLLWEPILNETNYPEYFARRQLEIVKEEMRDANVWCACDKQYAYSEHYPVNYDKNKSSKPRYIREYGDNYVEQFGPMNTMRRVRRGKNVSFYNGGETAMLRSASERFDSYLELRLDDTLSGGAMWAGIDHNRGYVDNEGAVGMLDLLRHPKYYYYLHTAQQSLDEIGAFCFIANDWAEDSPRDVSVYTNAEAVRLSVNGCVIDTITAEAAWKETEYSVKKGLTKELPYFVHPPIVFKQVPWEAGVLKAEAIVNGQVVKNCEVHTPKAPVSLKLVPQWAGVEKWTADGADLLMVHAFVVDINDNVVKSAEPVIHFWIEGDAQIVGDGSPWTHANPSKAEAGATGVLLRAGCSAGNVILHAEAEGLDCAMLCLETTPDYREKLLTPSCIAPKEKPVYSEDHKEYFSERQFLKSPTFFCRDIGTNKKATASSETKGNEAGNANRGNISTPWVAFDNSLPQWWQCDLEEECSIYGVTIAWLDDGSWYEYEVETSSDGEHWTAQCRNRASGQSRLPERFENVVTARFLRIVIYSVTSEKAVGIYQVEIHGDTQD